MLLAVGSLTVSDAAEVNMEVNARANPIRKVVTMLQTLQEKVKSEGEQEEEPPRFTKLIFLFFRGLVSLSLMAQRL